MNTDNTTPGAPEQRPRNRRNAPKREQGRIAAHPEQARITGQARQQLNPHIAEEDAADTMTRNQFLAAETGTTSREENHKNWGLFAIAILCAAAFALLLIFGTHSLHNNQIKQNTARFNSGIAESDLAETGTYYRQGPIDQTNGTVAANGIAMVPVGTATANINGVQMPVVVYLFNTNNSSVVTENAHLTAVANAARQNGGNITIVAYTDENGNPAYNQRLSERRAQAVAGYMKAHGVAPEQISAKGNGPTHRYANDAQDRRAEVTYTASK